MEGSLPSDRCVIVIYARDVVVGAENKTENRTRMLSCYTITGVVCTRIGEKSDVHFEMSCCWALGK